MITLLEDVLSSLVEWAEDWPNWLKWLVGGFAAAVLISLAVRLAAWFVAPWENHAGQFLIWFALTVLLCFWVRNPKWSLTFVLIPGKVSLEKLDLVEKDRGTRHSQPIKADERATAFSDWMMKHPEDGIKILTTAEYEKLLVAQTAQSAPVNEQLEALIKELRAMAVQTPVDQIVMMTQVQLNARPTQQQLEEERVKTLAAVRLLQRTTQALADIRFDATLMIEARGLLAGHDLTIVAPNPDPNLL